MIIETDRLVLRPLVAGDVARVFAMSRDPLLVRYMPDQVYRDEAEAEAVVRALGEAAAAMDPRVQPYVLGVEVEGELVGHVGLSAVPSLKAVEIGYAIDARWHGRGLASEAVGALTRWGLAGLSLPEVLGIVDEDNLASRRVLVKAGFADTGERTASAKLIFRRRA